MSSNETVSTRGQKIGKQIQRDMSEILSREVPGILHGAMATVTMVRLSPDFALAKVYVSVFPFDKHQAVLASLTEHAKALRGILGNRVKHQLRHVPELAFYLDDSLEYISEIDKLLK